jgi:hypothetical protein
VSAPPIPSRPTVYAGCLFRSALEARWAVFFQAQGITWNYEPETFRLASGTYIPDFHLSWRSGAGAWAEVKPGVWDVTPYDTARHLEFASSGRILVLSDGVPEPRPYVAVGAGYALTLQHWGPDLAAGGSDDPRLVAACRKSATTRFRRT